MYKRARSHAAVGLALACSVTAWSGRLGASELSRPGSGLPLAECYRAALKRSEVVATQAELITQAEERYRQATGSLFPAINGVATYQRQDKPSSSIGSSIFPADQTTVKLNASAPIFRGFREFAGIRQRARQIEVEEQAKAQAGVRLYLDMAENFYQVLTLEQDLRNLGVQIELTRKRAEELKTRTRIGRSRISEVLTTETAAAQLEAQAEVQRGQLLASREAFAFLTGLDRESALADVEEPPANLEELAKYLDGLAARPDVVVDEKRLSASEEGVAIARGGHLPSIDVGANYYFKRPGTLSDVSWDVLVTGTLPIFHGGTVQSQLREAVSANRQSELSLSRSRRLADQEVRALHEAVVHDRTEILALEKATDIASRNYEVQTREYRMGLGTNLDALQALTAYRQAQRDLDRVRLRAKLNFAKLETAGARRP